MPFRSLMKEISSFKAEPLQFSNSNYLADFPMLGFLPSNYIVS